MSSDTPKDENYQNTVRDLAKRYNMEVWHLLAKTDQDPDRMHRMIDSAHASLRLWLDVGSPINEQRGLYVLSRVYAEAGDAEKALYYAENCHRLSEEIEAELRDFDKAYTLEALARANAVAGNLEEASNYFGLAMAEGQNIDRDEDREIFEQDIRAGNWGAFPVS